MSASLTDLPPAAVLVVDDDPATADTLADYLRQHGHRVKVASSDVDTPTTLAGWTPDAAIIDPDAGGGVAADLDQQSGRPLLIAVLRPGALAHIGRDRLRVYDYAFSKAVSPAALLDRIAEYLADDTPKV